MKIKSSDLKALILQESDSVLSNFVVDKLKDIAKHINHSGKYGMCYYNPDINTVWWVADIKDGKDDTTSFEEIKHRFTEDDDVDDVIIKIEQDPNNEDDDWLPVKYEELL